MPQGGAALWRLDVDVAGSGVTGDLLAHCIDTAIWLNGEIDSVSGVTETFIKERKHNLTGKMESVGIDDASAFLAGLRMDPWRSSRPPGTPEAIRRSIRSKLTANMGRSLGISTICTGCNGLITRMKDRSAAGDRIHVTDGDHPYMAQLVGAGLSIGYEHSFIHQVADFLNSLDGDKAGRTDL